MKNSWAGLILRQRSLYVALIISVLSVCGFLVQHAVRPKAESAPTLAPSPTATFVTATATPTLTATATSTQTCTPTVTVTPSVTPSPTPTMTATATPTPTCTPVPVPTSDGFQRVVQVPILAYHYVSTPPQDADAIRQDLSVSPGQLEKQLRFFRDEGYTTITLNDLALALQIGHPLPEKPLILTFDDGYRDNYSNAFPLLQEYGFTATFFLITGLIDDGRPEYLTWEQVIEMDAAGMAMEAHGHTHPDLRNRSLDYLVWQMVGAKEAIEARTHKPVRFFCYPSGKYDDRVIQVLHSAHYWGAVTLHYGADHHSDRMFELKRVRVHGYYDVERLSKAIRCAMETVEGSPSCTMTP